MSNSYGTLSPFAKCAGEAIALKEQTLTSAIFSLHEAATKRECGRFLVGQTTADVEAGQELFAYYE